MKVYLSLLLLLLPCLSLSAQDLIFTTNKAKANDTNQYTAEVRELDFIRKMKRNNAFSFQIDGELYVQEIKTVTHKNGYVSIAAISPDGKNVTSVLSEKSGKLGGIIQVNGQAYSVFKVDEDYQFEEIREKEFACDFDDNLFTIGGHQKSADPGGTYANPTYDLSDYNDTTTVDVLLLYTTDAKNWADSVAYVTDIDHVISINETNKELIIANSGLPLKIRFVEALEIANNSMTSASDILPSLRYNTYNNHVSAPDDTVDIENMRNRYGADLVALMEYFNDGSGGIGYRINSVGGTEGGGFTVNRVQQMYFTYTLMHEIGHNFGNAHGRTQEVNEAGENGGLFQFSTGHLLTGSDDNKYVTVMHYTNLPGTETGTSIPYYSNPRIEYLSTPLGDYDGDGGPSDNALSMNISKNWIADYRPTTVDPPEINFTSTSISETIHPAGYTEKKLVIGNTGISDLEVKLDGALEYTSSLSKVVVKDIKQPLEITYGFEENEGFSTGTYLGSNNWIALQDGDNFKISSTIAYSGTQSLLLTDDQDGTAWFTSPFTGADSRYTKYTISMKIYVDSEWPELYIEPLSDNGIAGGILLNENGRFYMNGCSSDCGPGDKGYIGYTSDTLKSGEWMDLSIELSGETLTYDLNGTTRTRTNDTTHTVKSIQLVVGSSTNANVYIDDLKISATDTYGPALAIPDQRTTIRPGDTDTMSVYFYGNESAEGIYSGTVYLETNDPANSDYSIPVMLTIDPEANSTTGDFAFQLTGEPGFRMLSSPVSTSISSFLGPIFTQGATGADTTIGSPNVWIWNNSFDGSSSAGWLAITDLSTTIDPGDALLIYVFDQNELSDSTNSGFPKILEVSGSLTSGVSPSVNPHGDGFTFIGNPFASSVDWDLISRTDLTNSVYVYDANAGNWKSYNSGVGELTDGLVKPFQGFFVQTVTAPLSTPSLTINTSDRATGGTFLGKEKIIPYFRLEVSDEDQMISNSAYLVLNESSSINFDSFDAVELASLSARSMSLYSLSSGGHHLDINSFNAPETDLEIPIRATSGLSDAGFLRITEAVGMDDYSLFLKNGTTEIELSEVPIPIEIENSDQFKSKANQPLPLLTVSTNSNYSLILRRTTATQIAVDAPFGFSLDQNFPNPFNPETTIRFTIPKNDHVRLKIYNSLGQLVEVLADRTMNAGVHSVRFSGAELSSGVYFYTLTTEDGILSKKMLLLK